MEVRAEYSQLPTIRRIARSLLDYANLRSCDEKEVAEIQRLAFAIAALAGDELGNTFKHGDKVYFIRPAIKLPGCTGCAASGGFLTGLCREFIHRCSDEGAILVECPS